MAIDDQAMGDPAGLDELEPDALGDEQAEEPPPDPIAGYWAAGDAESLAKAIIEQQNEHDRVAIDRGFVTMWRIAHAARFGQDPANPGTFDTQMIGVEGVHGDQLRVRMNEPAALLRQQLTMATGQAAAFQAVALNTDTAAIAMAPINDAAVTYFYEKEMPRSRERLLLDSALRYGAGYAWWRWDKYAGEDVQVGTEQIPLPPAVDPSGTATAPLPIYGPSGAPVARIKRPWEHFCNPRERESHLWRGITERRNKYELMALYPAIAERIKGMTGDMTLIEQSIFGTTVGLPEDDLTVRHFYHVALGDPLDKSNVLRQGRYFACVGDVPIPGADGPLPVTRKCGMPIAELMPVKSDDVAFGHCDWWDVLSAQQGKDQITSDTMSNITLFGRSNAFKGPETEMDLDALAEGGGVFTLGANEQPPGFMDPPQMSSAAQWLSERFDKVQQIITALNSVQLGQPGANINSGEMAALFTNLAAEGQNDIQMCTDEARKRSANIVADLVMLNGGDEVVIQIVGEDQRPMLVKYRTSQLRGIRNVDMQTVPPMMRNTQGRITLHKIIQDTPPDERDEVATMITTGQARQTTARESAEWNRISWENEQLGKGIACTPSSTDDPKKHLRQHIKKLNELSLDPKANAKPIAAIQQHILQTLHTYYTTDPMLASFNDVPPPPPTSTPGNPPPPGAGGDTKVPGTGKGDGSPVPHGENGAAPPDRLGSSVPKPAQPPPGAAGQAA